MPEPAVSGAGLVQPVVTAVPLETTPITVNAPSLSQPGVAAVRGSAQAPAVSATFSVGGQTFVDVNATARASPQAGITVQGVRPPNLNRATMHAEIGAMVQAGDAGVTGGDGLLVVKGKNVCQQYCKGDIKTVARSLNLNSLTVQDTDGAISHFPTPDSLQTVKNGGQGWKKQ